MENGKVIAEAVTLNYGNFLQTVIDFLIIAFVIFMMIRTLNKLQRLRAAKEENTVHEEVVPKLTHQEELLTEIRNLLQKKPMLRNSS